VPFDRRSTRSDGVAIQSATPVDLLEYQGKQLFARHAIPVPDGRHARTVDEAVAAATEIGFPCVIKAQVKIGGRGKPGGIKVAANEDEARTHADAILGMDIQAVADITRCDEVSNGLVEALRQIEPSVPFVVRLDGTNDAEGRRILAEAGLPNVYTAATMNEAAERVVELAR
jgi:succinyl-CoA synthetase beta subunit